MNAAEVETGLTAPADFDADGWRERIEAALVARLAPAPGQLGEAMRYSTLDGGKRIRGMLVYAGAGCGSGASGEDLDALACAVELVHSYSLIHDDLPCMDDSDERRGAPSCHRAYSEALAVLAGDALQVLAFECLASVRAPLAPMVQLLGRALGAEGMAGGQALDLQAAGNLTDMEALKRIYAMKTGALITASLLLGARVAGLSMPGLQALDRCAAALGLGFQLLDDLSDTGEDRVGAPALLGQSGCRELADELFSEAGGFLQGLSGSIALHDLIVHIQTSLTAALTSRADIR